ncbi:MAG: 3'-5' exonuclease [Cytophagales bacterium]
MFEFTFTLMEQLLFLDIETVSEYKNFEELPERIKPLWNKKAQILSKGEITGEDLYAEKAGIYSEFGKIVVIGLGFLTGDLNKNPGLRVKALASHNEEEILKQFSNILDRMDSKNTILVAHNGKEFDFPYLSRRMLIKNIPLPETLNISGKKPWEIQHLDTMEMWKFGDWKSYTSLDLLAAIFDIPSSKSDIDGSMVSGIYHGEKDLEKISKYCIKDVVVCAQVFMKLRGLNLIEANNIQIVD